MSDSDDMDGYEKINQFVERCIAEARSTPDWLAESLRSDVYNEPGEAVGWLLGSYISGSWDLSQDDVDRLWALGRWAGYRHEQLVGDGVLARAAPGRGIRPPEPPGLTPLLEGGGHGPGRAKPGKREFPATWTDDDTIRRTMDIARHPSLTVKLPSGDFRAAGERDGVQMSVLVAPTGHVLTSYPVSGDAVVQNPLDQERAPHIERLQSLLDELVPPSEQEPRRSLDELMAVGEWPHVIASLRALDVPVTDEQREALSRFAQLAGLV